MNILLEIEKIKGLEETEELKKQKGGLLLNRIIYTKHEANDSGMMDPISYIMLMHF